MKLQSWCLLHRDVKQFAQDHTAVQPMSSFSFQGLSSGVIFKVCCF